MPPNTDTTLALVLTAGGAVGTAALISGIVQVIKTLFGDAWPGAGASRITTFVLSLVIVAWAYIGTVVEVNATTLFLALLAWYAIARLTMAVYDDVTAKPQSLRGPINPS